MIRCLMSMTYSITTATQKTLANRKVQAVRSRVRALLVVCVKYQR